MLRIRLSRVGKKKQPSYRLVVADSRAPRDGAFIKIIGHYNPRTDPTILEDFLSQYQRVRRMGPFSQLVGLLPGLSQIKGRLKVDEMDEKFFDRVEAIIYSMTVEERRHANIIDGSRRRRIAQGSGTTPADVNRVLKQYKEAKRIMQQISSGQDSNILSLFR